MYFFLNMTVCTIKIHRSIFITLILILAISTDLFGQGECPGQHCSAKAAIVNKMCKQLGQAGGVVFVEHNGSYCWCKCSCLASSTPVQVSVDNWISIGDIAVGDTVLALDLDGTWKQAPVVFSDGTTMPEEPYPYAIYVSVENGPTLITTAEHLFLVEGKKLKRADRLTPNDRLLDKDLRPLKIETLVSGSYHGPIHNIAVTDWSFDGTIDGHLVNTSGVISGDYFLELHFETASEKLITEPQVGSSEYLKRFGPPLGINKLKSVIVMGDAEFIPGRPFEEPDGAHSYLPPGDDIAKPGTQTTLDVTVPYEMAVYLKDHFRVYYPDIIYHIEWHDNRVNAFAWRNGNEQHVALLGGLLRHTSVKQEGVGLVLAHEVGHHYGGPPRYPSNPWSSCEGQADYWGASVAMRKVWWGHYALEQIQNGALQLYNLFANGLTSGNLIERSVAEMNAPNPTSLCTHPPALCRYETYLAAMRLDPKPLCAGVIGGDNQSENSP